jgi:hypothetical protein
MVSVVGTEHQDDTPLMAAYGRYMANEYPRRGSLFADVAWILGVYGPRGQAGATTNDAVKYLGAPDAVQLRSGRHIWCYTFAGPQGETRNLGLIVDGSKVRGLASGATDSHE